MLFSIFLNDIEDYLGGGIQINNTPIKLLAYADDFVVLATDKISLEKIIKGREIYYYLWVELATKS